MTAQVSVQRSSAIVESEILSLTRHRTSAESEQQKFSKRLLYVDDEISQLKVRHFKGDAAAGPALAKLEAEKKDLGYKIDGATVEISSFDEKIKPLREELRQFREADVVQDANRRFEKFQAKLDELVSARIATYRAACRSLYEEAVFLHSEIDLLPVNSTEERNLRLRAVEQAHNRLHAVSNEIVNASRDPRVPGWKDGPGFGPGPLTQLMAKLPPEQNGNGLH